jgi:hypothetical protein
VLNPLVPEPDRREFFNSSTSRGLNRAGSQV